MQVARNLGKTLRAFQPTIRELQVGGKYFCIIFLSQIYYIDALTLLLAIPHTPQDVSREFKSTLEREIGLDDNLSPTQNPYNSNLRDTTSTPSSTVDPSE